MYVCTTGTRNIIAVPMQRCNYYAPHRGGVRPGIPPRNSILRSIKNPTKILSLGGMLPEEDVPHTKSCLPQCMKPFLILHTLSLHSTILHTKICYMYTLYNIKKQAKKQITPKLTLRHTPETEHLHASNTHTHKCTSLIWQQRLPPVSLCLISRS